MYTLYIANKNYSSWSLRPWVLMRQLGIEFEERLVPFEAADNRQRFRTFSPAGKVPCLHAGEVVVWDSLAIVEFLAEGHPEVWPRDCTARAWARSATAEMHSGFGDLRTICSMTCGQRIALHERPKALLDDVSRIDELWNDGLARFGGPFLAGSAFTAVDAFYAPVVFRAQTYGLAWTGEAQGYQQRALALPAMVQWYEAALRETWRDEPHERDIGRYGTCTADVRAPPG